MGNPFIAGSEGGGCIDCEHCRGFQTDPGRVAPICLCGHDTLTYNWFHGNVVTGCRYWEPTERRETMPSDAE